MNYMGGYGAMGLISTITLLLVWANLILLAVFLWRKINQK